MFTENQVTTGQMIDAAHLELLRLSYKYSTLSRHNKELREFSDYCEENMIQQYDSETEIVYFSNRYGLDITDAELRLSKQQLDTRCTVRLLDDIIKLELMKSVPKDFLTTGMIGWQMGCRLLKIRIQFIIPLIRNHSQI